MSRTSDGEAGVVSADALAHRAASELPSVATVQLLQNIEPAALSNDGRLSYLVAVERAQGWLSSLTTRPIVDLVEVDLGPDEGDDPELVELAVASVRGGAAGGVGVVVAGGAGPD